MNNCERCKNKLSRDMTSPRRPVPVTYGETDMTVCYRCAYELNLIIAYWIDTEPMEDPVEWYKRVASPFPVISDAVKAEWRTQMESHCERLDRLGISYTVVEHADGSFSVTVPDGINDQEKWISRLPNQT